MASTLYKCLKYYQNGEKKILGDVKPFTKAKSHFANTRLFEKGATPKETMQLTISSTGKGGTGNSLQATKDDTSKMMLQQAQCH